MTLGQMVQRGLGVLPNQGGARRAGGGHSRSHLPQRHLPAQTGCHERPLQRPHLEAKLTGHA